MAVKKKAKKSYHVDLPNPHDVTAPWIEYAVYESKAEALAVLQKFFGADKQGRISLISEVDLGE